MTAIDAYFDTLIATLDGVRERQSAALEEAARCIAVSLRAGGMVYTFGTGHGHMLALELFYRAGGLARVRPILDERLMLHKSASESTAWERDESLAAQLLEKTPMGKGDVLIVASNSGRNAVPVALAIGAKARGATVIALTSMRHSSQVSPRTASGKRLFEVSDLTLDNGGALGDVSIVTEQGTPVGATSTAVGAAILQAVISRAIELSELNEWPVECYASSNVDGGDERNKALLDTYKQIIPGL